VADPGHGPAGQAEEVVSVDAAAAWQRATGSGVCWTLAAQSDLNVNVVRLEAGDEIGEHVNDDVDVVVAVLAGAGRLVVDGRVVALGPGTVVHVPRGASRRLEAASPLGYLSVHRRRAGLGVGRRPAS